MNLSAKIFLDPKAKSRVSQELKNGKKAINLSSNKHGWSHWKAGGARN